MKFYFARFTYKNNPLKTFHKFGVTYKGDAAERFNPKYDSRYSDFFIEILFSKKTTEENALKFEGWFLANFSKNFWLEEYLECPHGTYDNLSGITECVLLPDGTERSILNKLYEVKENI